MGYTTDFNGAFELDKPLAPEHKAYLEAFATTRRMKRDPVIVATFPDPLREAVGLPVGDDGGYYVGSRADHGQERDTSILDYNSPPQGQPGLWLQWTPNDAGTAIEWDEAEKFYDYVEWLDYLIGHFLEPWGYSLNGEVSWAGEEDDDRGVIYVKDNEVQPVESRLTNPGPSWERNATR